MVVSHSTKINQLQCEYAFWDSVSQGEFTPSACSLLFITLIYLAAAFTPIINTAELHSEELFFVLTLRCQGLFDSPVKACTKK